MFRGIIKHDNTDEEEVEKGSKKVNKKMKEEKIEMYPIDLLTKDCKCPHCHINKGYIDTGGVVEGRRLLKCVNCGEIVYGCD